MGITINTKREDVMDNKKDEKIKNEAEEKTLPTKEDEENIRKSKGELEKVKARMEILRDTQDITQNLNR